MKDITIVSVLGPEDKFYIQRNLKLIEKLNKRSPRIIHLIDNFFSYEKKLELINKDIFIHEGVEQNETIHKNFRGSYQHAESLNSFFRQNKIKTKYLLIIDPDFYIIYNDWISKVTKYMDKKRIDFFGSPWHPKWYKKYRNFPCVHCLFINLENINQDSLDFTPNLINKNSLKKLESESKNKKLKLSSELSSKKWYLIILSMYLYSTKRLIKEYQSYDLNVPKILSIIESIFVKLIKFFSKKNKKNYINSLSKRLNTLILNRRLINSSKDTGYLIEKKFSSKKYKKGILKPVVNFSDSFQMHHLRNKFGRNLERIIPDKISYVPPINYYAKFKNNFEEFGLPPLYKENNWEEFLWREKPFGFHIRRFNKKNRVVEKELELVDKVIDLISDENF